MEHPLTKIKKKQLLVRKSNFSFRIFHSAIFRIWSSGKNNQVYQICVIPFSNFGNWITFGPFQRRYFFTFELHCSLPSLLVLLFYFT